MRLRRRAVGKDDGAPLGVVSRDDAARRAHTGGLAEVVDDPGGDRGRHRPFAHVTAVEHAGRLGVAVIEAEIDVVDRVLHVVAPVHEQDRRARLVEQALVEQRQLPAPRDVVLECLATEDACARGHQIHQIRGRVPRPLLPLGSERDVHAATPVDRAAKPVAVRVGELHRPVAAERRAHRRAAVGVEIVLAGEPVEDRRPLPLGIRAGEDRRLADAWHVDEQDAQGLSTGRGRQGGRTSPPSRCRSHPT